MDFAIQRGRLYRCIEPGIALGLVYQVVDMEAGRIYAWSEPVPDNHLKSHKIGGLTWAGHPPDFGKVFRPMDGPQETQATPIK